MGLHGTKVVVFNLWFNDDGDLELDFDSDAEVSNFFFTGEKNLPCNIVYAT